jgi:hypothetical protein
VFVAGADEGADLPEQTAGALEHLLAKDRVRVHQMSVKRKVTVPRGSSDTR